MHSVSINAILKLSGAVLGLFVFLFVATSMFETLDAESIMVVQSPVKGTLSWHTSPGVKTQKMGKITKYPRRAIYTFETPVRFNDGGHGTMHGSVQYEMPLDDTNLTSLHVRFGGHEAIQKQLVETVVNKALYMTGPLMSSKESYAERRNYLISYVEDQIAHGVYKTTQRETKAKDSMTGQDKTVTVVEIVLAPSGLPERQEGAVLAAFGIRPFNFAITSLPYDEAVELQIKAQQQLIMQVQTAIADAKRAEQASITAEKNGQAEAAKAKWEQEVIKAKAVTEAEQKLAVATLDALAAAQTKQKEILLGEGEATRKRLVMAADGALTPKLDAWLKAQEIWAKSVAEYKGKWVPDVVFGDASAAKSGSGATDLVNLLTVKTAKDLAVDFQLAGGQNTK